MAHCHCQCRAAPRHRPDRRDTDETETNLVAADWPHRPYVPAAGPDINVGGSHKFANRM